MLLNAQGESCGRRYGGQIHSSLMKGDVRLPAGECAVMEHSLLAESKLGEIGGAGIRHSNADMLVERVQLVNLVSVFLH